MNALGCSIILTQEKYECLTFSSDSALKASKCKDTFEGMELMRSLG